MVQLTRTIELDDISPEEAAHIFAGFNNEKQAAFLTTVWRIAKDWPGAGWCQQSCSIVEVAGPEAREWIRTIGAHLELEEAEEAEPNQIETDDRPEWELRTGFREEDFS